MKQHGINKWNLENSEFGEKEILNSGPYTN